MRPKKIRWIKCGPEEKCFRPLCKPIEELEGVFLAFDEFEAVRLTDLEGLKHEESARKMKISRPTFSRIVSSARGKIADALVNCKAIKIEGGSYRIAGRKKDES
ncbi:MAG: DUF134 domain-containing protein [Candidatus Omnitrophota bacterium]